jgi:hypothetical protein
VHDSIDRWEEAGLVDASTAEALRAELRRHATATSGRLAQYLMASAGAVVLVIAGGLFIDWAWPILAERLRTALLATLGIGVLVAGMRMEGRFRWRPAAQLMQAGAVGLILAAYLYAERGWEPTSPVGVLIGIAGLSVPIVLTGRAMRRDVFMPAVNMAAGLAFLAVFLERSTPLSADDVVWTLDAVLAAAVLVLVAVLRGDPDGHRHPWALNAFVVAMGVGFFLVAVTALETLHLSDDAFLALDAWLALSAALTLWGMHRAPEGLRRGWFERLLSLQVLVWIPLGALTVYATFDGPPEAFLFAVGSVGVLAFVHGDRHGLRELMAAATLAFVLPAWFWAVDRGGALGGVLAMMGTAAFLFWASGRRGRGGSVGGSARQPPEDGRGVPGDEGEA